MMSVYRTNAERRDTPDAVRLIMPPFTSYIVILCVLLIFSVLVKKGYSYVSNHVQHNSSSITYSSLFVIQKLYTDSNCLRKKSHI